MTIWKDSSFYLQGRLEMMIRNAFQGLLLVFLVLSLFLRPSLAIWVAIGLPISFMGAFATMGLVGASINLVSLFAFIVVLGILVDDAIVVGESVYTLGSKGEKSLQGIYHGNSLGGYAGNLCDHYQYGCLCTDAVPSRLAWEINEGYSFGCYTCTLFLADRIEVYSALSFKPLPV
jgi:hypothetical protein